MKIEACLYATLSKYLPEKNSNRCTVLEVETNATVGQVIDRLDIPGKSVKLVFVNGIRGTTDTVLSDGDRIGLFPPVGGG